MRRAGFLDKAAARSQFPPRMKTFSRWRRRVAGRAAADFASRLTGRPAGRQIQRTADAA